MEDCCAVCAEPLEWVGYGPCGHREVCFRCIARLRFVLKDKQCCICKQDCSSVYITKALGDYTRIVTDWKSLLSESSGSNAGKTLWYDNVVDAYFNDEEPFKTIKAMCRLYCSICENGTEEELGVKGMMKKGYIFKNIDTLRRHQFAVHKVFMCELCLEGKKVFICEQKLYSKSQLDQHSRKGDSEVDGNEEERGGFAGHPICAFCRKRFYGDNELYQHMSQEHYTCHICQRARPGHYEYYCHYDDLEAHFRQEHMLCEHPECLAKKFVVFPSEAELKRHNATIHGGHMSRSQRNAALQIPVSFHYRRVGQDSSDDSFSRRGGRSRVGYPYSVNGRSDELNATLHASVESAQLEDAMQESPAMSSSYYTSGSSNTQSSAERPTFADHEVGTSSVPGDGEHEPSRYLAAVFGAGPSTLGDAAFPPLPGISKSARRRAKLKSQGPTTMASLLGGSASRVGGRGGIRVLNASDYRSSTVPSQPRSLVSHKIETTEAHQGMSITSRCEGVGTPVSLKDEAGRGHSGTALHWLGSPPVAMQGVIGGGNSSIGDRALWRESERNGGPCYEDDNLSFQISQLSMADIRSANKALVEHIRAGLDENEQHFADFKDLSCSFRKGEMSSKDYYVHIARLGLSYVVPELARLCPDPRKGKELMDAHAAQLTNNVVDPRSLHPGLAGAFSSSPSLSNEVERRSVLPSSNTSISELGSAGSSEGSLPGMKDGTPSRAHADMGAVEVLSRDEYRRAKGKSKVTESNGCPSRSPLHITPSAEGTLMNELAAARDRTPQVLVKAFTPVIQDSSSISAVSGKSSARLEGGWACGLCTLVNTASSWQCAACGTGKPGEEGKGIVEPSGGTEKRKKKNAKFQRVHLGDGSAAALLDCMTSNPWVQTSQTENGTKSLGRSSGQGAWTNGGGQRLVSLAQREAIADDAWSSGK